MSQKISSRQSRTTLVTGTALTLLLSGCVGDMPHRGAWVGAPSNKRVQMALSIPDVYFYYPDYAIYYNSTRRCYVYQEKGVWLTGSLPPKVSARDLQGARSVRMAFHDAPALYHAGVLKNYPKNAPREKPFRPVDRNGGAGKKRFRQADK